MAVTFQTFNPSQHKELIIEYHCRMNYETNTFPLNQKPGYADDLKQWQSLEHDDFDNHIAKGLETTTIIIKMIVKDANRSAGNLYVDLADLKQRAVYKTDIGDNYIEPEIQTQGIGTRIMEYIDTECRRMGINLIRSGTGVQNIKSGGLHKKNGYTTSRYEFEKWI